MIISAQIIAGREVIETHADAHLPWWSFGKTVLAAMAFKLAEQGRLDLDTPLAGKPFTIRQLLAHHAGVRDYGGLARDLGCSEELVRQRVSRGLRRLRARLGDDG